MRNPAVSGAETVVKGAGSSLASWVFTMMLNKNGAVPCRLEAQSLSLEGSWRGWQAVASRVFKGQPALGLVVPLCFLVYCFSIFLNSEIVVNSCLRAQQNGKLTSKSSELHWGVRLEVLV